jgi:hypothetical protein
VPNLLERIEDFVEALEVRPPGDFPALATAFRDSGALKRELLSRLALRPENPADLLLGRQRLSTIRETLKGWLVESVFGAGDPSRPARALPEMFDPGTEAEQDALLDAWARDLRDEAEEFVRQGLEAHHGAAAGMRAWVEECLLLYAIDSDDPPRRVFLREGMALYWSWKRRWIASKGLACMPMLESSLADLSDRLQLASGSPFRCWLVLLEACSFERAADALGGAPHQPILDVEIRLDWMERHAPDADILDQARLLRLQLARRRLRLFVDLSNRPRGLDDSPSAIHRSGSLEEGPKDGEEDDAATRYRAHWNWLQAGALLHAEARTLWEEAAAGPRPLPLAERDGLRGELASQRRALEELRQRLRDEVASIPPAELERWRRDIATRADDLLSQVGSRDLAWSCEALGDLRYDLKWLSADFDRRLRENPPRAERTEGEGAEELSPAEDGGAGKTTRAGKPPRLATVDPAAIAASAARLGRLRKEVRDEHREQLLRQRLEKLLTRTGANALELLVNVLVFFVLALLAVFLFFVDLEPHQPPHSFMLAWDQLDAYICAILLFEFFLKLGLSEDRKWYFKRRWFTDFLPSLPFGLLVTLYLHHFHAAAAFGQAARSLRLVRVARATRAIRLISFLQRVADRLARRFRGLIDVDVKLFGEHRDRHVEANPVEHLRSRVDGLQARALQAAAAAARSEPRARVLFWGPQIAILRDRVAELADEELAAREVVPKSETREVRLEAVIERLRDLDGVAVESAFGANGAKVVASYLSFLSPILSPLLGVRGARSMPPAQLIAAAGRRLAVALDLVVNGLVNTVRDLYGIVTAAELFSFIGDFLQKIFKRHKNRFFIGLAILAIGFLLVKGAESANAWGVAGRVALVRAVDPEIVNEAARRRGGPFARRFAARDSSQPALHALGVSAAARESSYATAEEARLAVAAGIASILPPEALAAPPELRAKLAEGSDGEAAARWIVEGRIALAAPPPEPIEALQAKLRAALPAPFAPLDRGATQADLEDRSTPATIAIAFESSARVSDVRALGEARREFLDMLEDAIPADAMAGRPEAEVVPREAAFSVIGRALQRSFGAVLIILGLVGFTAVAAGNWLTRRAGKMVDEHIRVAEAQFINLMKDYKKRAAGRDLSMLARRVLRPELRVAEVVRGDANERLLGMARARLVESAGLFQAPAADLSPPDPALERLRPCADRATLLYRDYLDGAVLHRSDVKTTEQLLGNIAMLEVIERANLSRAERRKLERLDLSKGRAAFGPYTWLYFITNSISQKVGAKVIEHNRRHQTNEFNALHFLTLDPAAEQALNAQVKPGAAERVRADRRDIVRSVFGTYPLDEVSINVYRLYRDRYEGGVRVFRLPFDAALLALRGLGVAMRKFARLTRDFLRPEKAEPPPSSHASREVAYRKIHRMRNPVYLAALELRSRVDLAYLDVNLPGCDFVGCEGETCDDDLGLAQASPAFRQEIDRRRVEYGEMVARFQRRLPDLNVPDDLRSNSDARRLWFTAFCLNERDLRTLVEADEKLAAIYEGVRKRAGWPVGYGLPRRALFGASRFARRLFNRWFGAAEQPLRDFLAARKQRDDAATRPAWLERAWLLDVEGFRGLVEALTRRDAAADPNERASEILRELAGETRRFQSQLVTARAVQTLAVLDVLNYRQIIDELGEFDE